MNFLRNPLETRFKLAGIVIGKAKRTRSSQARLCKTKNSLVQNGVMRTNNLLVALGSNTNRIDGVAGTGRRVGSHQRTMHVVEGASLATAKIRHHFGVRRGIRRLLAVFQRPLLRITVKPTTRVETSTGPRRLTSTNEIRDRNRRQQADDRHDDHDFHEREARLTGGHFHTYFILPFSWRCELSYRRVTYLLILFRSRIAHSQPRCWF